MCSGKWIFKTFAIFLFLAVIFIIPGQLYAQEGSLQNSASYEQQTDPQNARTSEQQTDPQNAFTPEQNTPPQNPAESEQNTNSQTHDFIQKLEWEEEPNALEYQIIIQDSLGQEVLQSDLITDCFFEFTLPAGEYRYSIIAYDFLGHEASRTEWHNFTITKALRPEINLEQKEIEVPRKGKTNTLEIPVDIENITKDSTVELVNTKTGERIPGTLVVEEIEDSETYDENEAKSTSATFENVKTGDWKLVITNPSGYSTDSEVITVSREQKEAVDYGEFNITGTALIDFILTEPWNSFLKNDTFLIQNLLGFGGAVDWYFMDKNDFQFGLSLDYNHFKRIKQKDAVYDLNLSFDAANFSFLVRRNFLDKKIGINARLGAGFLLITEGVNYHGNYSKMVHNPLYYGYICYEGGLAFNWIPFNHMIVQTGLDFLYARMNSGNGMFLWPYLSLGVRF